jgi:sugar phosphate isomerase/epimerase
MSDLQFCLFSSTADIEKFGFIVKILTGEPEDIASRAAAWGYDGIEFLPDPLNIPDPVRMEAALQNAGVFMPVVNSGRFGAQGMPLIQDSKNERIRAVEAFKQVLDFAGHFKARVGLGMARGSGIPGASKAAIESIAADVFEELAAHAAKAGAIIVLEAAEPDVTGFINTNAEVMQWVDRISNPYFSVMLDTHQLNGAETSIEEGIRVTRGEATHIHLYDPSRWPPGVLEDQSRLDWPNIIRILKETHLPRTGSLTLAPEGDAESAARKALAYLKGLLKGDD